MSDPPQFDPNDTPLRAMPADIEPFDEDEDESDDEPLDDDGDDELDGANAGSDEK